MTNKVTEVFRVTVPSVGLVLKARADINGKQDSYIRRIKDDAKNGEVEILTDYSANLDCIFNLKGGAEADDIRFFFGEAPVKDMPVFFETRYFFRGDFKEVEGRTVKDVRVEHRMASVVDAFNFDDGTLVGSLDFINEPGRFRLDLRIVFSDNKEQMVRLEFMVVSVKMNVARDYAEIVKMIDDERPNIVRAFLSKTFWGAMLNREDEQTEKDWYDILVDVFDYYENACNHIVNNPHRRYIATDDWRKADRIKRWTPQLLNRFNRMSDDQRAYERFRTERIVAECDTIENRFVLYSLNELRHNLEEFGEKLKGMEKVSQVWKDGVICRADKLRKLALHPFFRGVSNFDCFKQQSLVLQKRAGYAQILTAWLKLKSALKPGGDDIGVSYRPISTLYEFWCFLKIRDFFKARFGEPVNEEWGDSVVSDILDTPELTDSYTGDGQICKIGATFTNEETTYLLSYQKTYSVKEGEDGETISGLNPQRPDIVLSISKGGSSFTYLFDAKYRIWTKNECGVEIDASPRSAIDDMHRYRDAILYRLKKRELKHEIIGAYVLYPGRPEPHLCKEYEKSIDEENIGAIPVLPGHLDQLEMRLNEILTKNREMHLGKTISTRGTTVVIPRDNLPMYWLENYLDATFILGYCKSQKHLEWIKNNNLYNVRYGLETPGGVSESKVRDKALKFLILYSLDSESINTFHVFRIHTVSGPKSFDEIKELGYPTDSNHKDFRYLCLNLFEEITFGELGVSHLLTLKRLEQEEHNLKEWKEGAPIFVKGREILKAKL